jgi:hypothetical protein
MDDKGNVVCEVFSEVVKVMRNKIKDGWEQMVYYDVYA